MFSELTHSLLSRTLSTLSRHNISRCPMGVHECYRKIVFEISLLSVLKGVNWLPDVLKKLVPVDSRQLNFAILFLVKVTIIRSHV